MKFAHVVSFVVILLAAFGPTLSAQACQPDSAARRHLARVQRDLDVSPSDPIHFFRLAVDLVALCRDDEALQALDHMTALGGGMDPSAYRGLARLQSSPRFLEIVAKVRRDNPQVIVSRPAFTIARPSLFPEGMAFDSATRRVYAGSTSSRLIVWTDSTGVVHNLVESGQDGLGAVLGLHVDARRRQLWAVSTGLSGSKLPPVTPGLFQYDLTSARLVARYVTADTSTGDFFNDVVVHPVTGAAYTTRTPSGTVYVATPGDTVLRQLVPAGSVPAANGITLIPDGSALVVAGGLGFVRIDLDSRRVTPIARSAGVIDVTIDGLYMHWRSLIGIQNGVHPGRVVRFELDSTLTRTTRMTVLESYNPGFDGMSTGAVSGDAFYFMANTRQGRSPLMPPSTDAPGPNPVMVLSLPLNP